MQTYERKSTNLKCPCYEESQRLIAYCDEESDEKIVFVQRMDRGHFQEIVFSRRSKLRERVDIDRDMEMMVDVSEQPGSW